MIFVSIIFELITFIQILIFKFRILKIDESKSDFF